MGVLQQAAHRHPPVCGQFAQCLRWQRQFTIAISLLRLLPGFTGYRFTPGFTLGLEQCQAIGFSGYGATDIQQQVGPVIEGACQGRQLFRSGICSPIPQVFRKTIPGATGNWILHMIRS